MSEETGVAEGGLKRSVSWKQGMFIALGVPLLILPSLYDVSIIVWGLCIVVWCLSVIQGFLQNLAYGEMVTVFPNATGLPGCAQTVFQPKNKSNPHDLRKFVGAFSAWCYWFAWCPVVAIFTMLIGDYLIRMFDLELAGWANLGLYLAIGLCIVILMYVLGSRGLEGGAKLGTILAIISIVPIVIIIAGAFVTGMFDLDLITDRMTAPGWSWGFEDLVLLFGCFGLAQWSACAWETAAIYGPEYKEPGKDVPKALFSCGLICLFMYFFVSVGVYGSVDNLDAYGNAALVPIAEKVFGDLGKYVALFLLIVAMILVIQTGFLGSSRTLFAMSQNGNMPRLLSKTNKNGAPIYAMLFQFAVGMCLIPLGTPGMILAASSFGFCFALGMAMVCFIKTHRDPRFKDQPRVWSAPRGWYYVAIALAIYQFFVLIPCLAYFSIEAYGPSSVVIGAIILLIYIPLWFVLQRYEAKNNDSSTQCRRRP